MKINNSLDFIKITSKGNYELSANIDFKGQKVKWIIDDFRGTLEGNGYTIKNIVIVRKVEFDEQNISLINSMCGATLKNVSFENVRFEIDSGIYFPKVSALCGECEKSILENVKVVSNLPNIPMVDTSNSSSYINCKLNGCTKKEKLVGFSYKDIFLEK